MNDILTAKDLEIFLHRIRNSTEQFNINFANVGEYDKLKTDYEHDIEFEKNYNERNKLCTEYHKMLNDRRKAKDMVAKCEVVKEFTKTDRVVINKLEKLLGDMRKKEEMLENRYYKRRAKVGD